MALSHELTGFGAALDSASKALKPEDRFALLAPRCIARSALFVALDRFTCPEKMAAEPGYLDSPVAKTHSEHEVQKQSMHVIQLASEQLHTLGMDISRMIKDDTDIAQPYSLGRVSPFIMDSAYAGAATFHWLLGETGKDVYRTAAADLDMLLDTLSSRWRLGSAYRDILMVYDVSARVEASMSFLTPPTPRAAAQHECPPKHHHSSQAYSNREEPSRPSRQGRAYVPEKDARRCALFLSANTSQVFLITGASGGLGKEIASILYEKNGKIYMAARSRAKTGEVMEQIKAAHPKSNGQLIFLPLILDDLTTIKASAQEFLAQESRLDVLYNNAGVIVPPQGSKTV
ncbi:hypothetical protein AUP68_02399 [Ilyonectria robusta]